MEIEFHHDELKQITRIADSLEQIAMVQTQMLSMALANQRVKKDMQEKLEKAMKTPPFEK